MKPIVSVPHKALSSKAKTVTSFDRKLHKLISDMKQSLTLATNPRGVGLAAPQVGVSMRVFITKPNEHAPIRVFINPEIIHRSDDQTSTHDKRGRLEGCLSIPNLWGNVKRAKEVTLKYQDEHGTSHEETFTGFMATIVQHETDHTNGILYTQRVIEQKQKLYEVATDEHGKEVLDEVQLP